MDSTVLVALFAAGGVALSGLLSYAGVRFTQRQSRAAAEATAALDREKVDAGAYEAARETWTETVAEMRRQVAELREEAESGRRVVRELRVRVEELESGRDTDRDRIRVLAEYARTLLRILAQHEITYPEPPPALNTTT